MLVLLPPSETKREGGDPERRLSLPDLLFPDLLGARIEVIEAAKAVSSDPDVARSALGLGPRSVSERLRNLDLDGAPALPAIERYSGVLYDGLASDVVRPADSAWLRNHVVIHSAMFGPVRATDPIPAYRLSHDSRLPAFRLKDHWRRAAGGRLGEHAQQFDVVLDLRSGGYRELAPLPDATVLDIVSDTGGRRRALNHWNKHANGVLVSIMMREQPSPRSAAEFVAWCSDHGILVERDGGRWQLVAESLQDAVGSH